MRLAIVTAPLAFAVSAYFAPPQEWPSLAPKCYFSFSSEPGSRIDPRYKLFRYADDYKYCPNISDFVSKFPPGITITGQDYRGMEFSNAAGFDQAHFDEAFQQFTKEWDAVLFRYYTRLLSSVLGLLAAGLAGSLVWFVTLHALDWVLDAPSR
jgi:hypothetical protein